MQTGHEAALRRHRPMPGTRGTDQNALLAVATKPPKLRSEFVRRPALVRMLMEAPGPLALLIAPPGYGKSTLLSEWAEHDSRPFLWVDLGRCDQHTLSAPAPQGAFSDLAHLVSRTRVRQQDFVLVLDDAHLADASALRNVVQAGLSELPKGSTIALASRAEPALPLGKLRAHRNLTEIRMQDLAMSPAEAAALLRQSGLEPQFEEVQTLVSRTEGWPAALYLAALTLRQEPERLVDFGGQHHLLSEYLRDEVLTALPSALKRFAVRTSVLDELSGPICDVVLERRGSGAVLGKLARANPLLVPIDPSHETYRWHTSMREALRAELRRTHPELEAGLRLRASGWYSRRGDTRRAIDQTAAAGDAELTGALLWRNILAYVSRGRNDLVRRWLSNFASSSIADYAPLALSASLSALVAGDASDAQRWSLTGAAALAREGSTGREARSLASELAVIEAMSAHDGIDRMGEIAINAVEFEPKDSLWRPLCLLLSGVSTYLQGDRAAAGVMLEEGVRLSGSRAPGLGSLCIAHRAIIAFEQEDWELAAELTDEASTVVEQSSLTTQPLSALVFAAAAASRGRQGRIDEAKRDLRRGRDLLAELGDFVPWYGAEARILLAHASLWLADTVGARTLLAEASRYARKVPKAVIFAEWFDRAWAYMDTMAETSLGGPSSLTIAELRILRFLPSHRSFREIAAQLGVSANTVKTQAHAVYRKLGAASRSEAVAQAIEAGLLWR